MHLLVIIALTAGAGAVLAALGAKQASEPTPIPVRVKRDPE
jgi:hypothetical protein